MAEIGKAYIESQAKRRLDLYGGLLVATALAPASAAATIAAQIDNRSFNPFYRQDRVGRNGRLVDFWKLRTLPISKTAGDMQLFGTYDPRATKIGGFLRATGLDEWPQLVGVINGSSSLVGMRELPEAELEECKKASPDVYEDWLPLYESDKHGLTGASQIYKRFQPELNAKVRANAMAIDIVARSCASLENDLAILVATPPSLVLAAMKSSDSTQKSV